MRASFPPCSEGNHHLNNRRAQPNFAVSWNGGVGEALDSRKYQDLETIANSLHPKVLFPITRWRLLLQANSMTMIHGPPGCIAPWIFPSFVLRSYDDWKGGVETVTIWEPRISLACQVCTWTWGWNWCKIQQLLLAYVNVPSSLGCWVASRTILRPTNNPQYTYIQCIHTALNICQVLEKYHSDSISAGYVHRRNTATTRFWQDGLCRMYSSLSQLLARAPDLTPCAPLCPCQSQPLSFICYSIISWKER